MTSVSLWPALTRLLKLGEVGVYGEGRLPETLTAAPEPRPRWDDSRRMLSAIWDRAVAPLRGGKLLDAANTLIRKVLQRAAADIYRARGRLVPRRGSVNFQSGRDKLSPAAAAASVQVTMTKVAHSPIERDAVRRRGCCFLWEATMASPPASCLLAPTGH